MRSKRRPGNTRSALSSAPKFCKENFAKYIDKFTWQCYICFTK